MKEDTSHKNSEKHDERECAGKSLSAQKAPAVTLHNNLNESLVYLSECFV